jgi:hypothetical protein
MATARGDHTPPNPVKPEGHHAPHWNTALQLALDEARKDPNWPKQPEVACRVDRQIIVTGNPGDVRTYSVILETI